MAETDLFGAPIIGNPEPVANPTRRKPTKPRGYAAPPGTGPAGETCHTCTHKLNFKRYRKCALVRAQWTGGPGTDILARSPACAYWKPNTQ